MTFPKNVMIMLAVALVLCVAACKEKPQQSKLDQVSKVLAKVNGVAITSDDLNFRLQRDHGNVDDRTRSLDDIINLELFYQQGLKLGLDKDPSYQSKLAKFEREPAGAKRVEMARRVFNTQIATTVNLMPKDGKEYYDRNADRIATELHLQLIKFADRQKAEDVLKKIRGGASFEAVARTAMGDTGKDGREPWDLGFQKWQQIPVDFVEPVYRLNPGEVSELLGTPQTEFQIVRLVERRKIPKLQYDAIQGVVMNRLRDLKLLEAYSQYVAKLRKEANIVTF